MIINSYTDEAGIHTGAPVLVMGGFVARLGQWADFERKWGRTLKRYNVSCHHTKKWRDRVGDFKDWDRPTGQAYMKDLCKIISKHTFFGFTVTMKPSDYIEFYRPSSKQKGVRFHSMYGVCFRGVISLVPDLMRKEFGNGQVTMHLILETGAQGSGDAAIVFDEFKKRAPPELAGVVDTVTFAEKSSFAGLQAADLVTSTAYLREQDGPALTEVPGPFSLAAGRAAVGHNPPRLHFELNAAALQELRDDILARRAAACAFGERKAQPGGL